MVKPNEIVVISKEKFKKNMDELDVLCKTVRLGGWTRETLAEIVNRIEKVDSSIQENMKGVYAR